MTKCISIEDPRNEEYLRTATDWQEAVTELLTFWAKEGRPYSSGEVAACIRQHRSDLRFQVPALGALLRDLFYGNSMPQYDDDGDGNGACSPVQRSRFTVGKYPDRTPADREVFVYGPCVEVCDEHEFEVYIPRPGGVMADAPLSAVPAPCSTTAPGSQAHADAQAAYVQKTLSAQKTLIAGAKSKLGTSDYVARVRQETRQEPRMYLGRPIFEALCHMSGTPIRAGQPVYVKVEMDTKVTITLTDPANGARPCNISTEAGCVLFSSGDTENPFPCGKYFKVTVSPTEITIDLSQAL
jgi:hypothetical protein